MNEQEIIEAENQLMANVFAKKSLVLARGKGAVVWDINGKEYIDCTGSYGVALLGHSHPKVVKAICEQAEKLISCHASFYNDKRSEFLKKLVAITPKGLNKAFLSNSGAEAVECAIKLARKFTGKPEIIAMMGAFHGKTMGALSATWDKKYREPFQPLVPEFKHVPPDNLDKVREAITEKTAAVLAEPVRGEGGVRVPPDGFLKGLREVCDERNVLLMFDEVQTGFGRTGKLFACEHAGIVPDVMCLAKPVAGGLPIGVTIAKENIMSSLKLGEHSTTFSGSPLVCAAGCAAIDAVLEEKLAERAAENGEYFKDKLEELQRKHTIVKEVRGLGLMLGVELRYDVLSVILKAKDQGILILDAGRNVLRFLPPLVISKEQIDKVVIVLDEVLGEEENARASSTPSN
ncbi:MAG TPA: aspartate aminotransferase family protein [Candidatus Bathyarchaeia archaeon]|nr:aspartate aminotransferase family protein [Candidatus Bathyarchaeia archaeon]